MINDGLPLLLQRLGVGGHPIHVIQQDESCDVLLRVFNEELFNGLGVVADAIDSSCLELLEALLGKIIGATILGVFAGQIGTVEIVVFDGYLSHDELKVVLDKVPNGGMSALLLQEISLGIGDTVEEGESNAVTQEPHKDGIPHLLLNARVINISLLFYGLGIQEFKDGTTKARDETEVAADQPGQEARASTEVEGRTETLAVEVVSMFIPEATSFLVQMGPEAGVVESRELFHLALAEELPELLIGELLDGCDLESEQRILAGIFIDCVDVLAVKSVGEHVATGGGDDHNAVLFLIELKSREIDTRIFPGAVEDYLGAVALLNDREEDEVEQPAEESGKQPEQFAKDHVEG
jgi:hypothetical protein